jgi:hypothetical protein
MSVRVNYENISRLKREDGDYYRGSLLGFVNTAQHLSRTLFSYGHVLVIDRTSNGIGARRQNALKMNLVSANVLGSFKVPKLAWNTLGS